MNKQTIFKRHSQQKLFNMERQRFLNNVASINQRLKKKE